MQKKKKKKIVSSNLFGAGQVEVMEGLEEKFIKCIVIEEPPLSQGNYLKFGSHLFSFLMSIICTLFST